MKPVLKPFCSRERCAHKRGIELQKLIDDDYRELAVKVLKHVRDFNRPRTRPGVRAERGGDSSIDVDWDRDRMQRPAHSGTKRRYAILS